jgi:hypothetical protein
LTARCQRVLIVARGKFLAELFHTTKKFVLLCRTDPASKKFFLLWAAALGKSGAFRSKIDRSSYFVKRQF